MREQYRNINIKLDYLDNFNFHILLAKKFEIENTMFDIKDLFFSAYHLHQILSLYNFYD